MCRKLRVIGGLLAFGLVGIFVGPVVLAVAYTLLEAWIERRTCECYEVVRKEYERLLPFATAK